jgi:hypothetical protein
MTCIPQKTNAVALLGFAAYLMYSGSVTLPPEILNDVTARDAPSFSNYIMADLGALLSPFYDRISNAATATISCRHLSAYYCHAAVRKYLVQQVGVVCGLHRRPRDPVHRDTEPDARGLPTPGVSRGPGVAFLRAARLMTRVVSPAQAAAVGGVRTSRGGIEKVYRSYC